ncbi:ABC transporter permease [Fodinicola acaciae]|uniref:ABC transporter permease n=1 Tax=Fodinicola acaciae TaxID=2681555 RepID=UPI0013D763C8|nr:ABC transporter permease [Fodinicola acaciae]
MISYVLRRLVQAVPLLLGISIIVFLLLQMTPGGPLVSGEGATQMSPEQVAKLREQYGLDQPLPVQYLHWIGGLLTGDWGTSYNTGDSVLSMIGERVPVTLLITGLALVVALLVSLPVGVFSAYKRNSVFDYAATGAAFAGLATPSFWFGLMLLYVFAFQLRWLPSSGLTDLRQEHQGVGAIGDLALHLILPVAVLSLISVAHLTRYVRSSMIEVLDQDYVRTARGSGLPERTVVLHHALKNAAAPVVTIAVLSIPELFLGAVITESIFSLSGMGRLFVDSANLRDYPVLLGILMIAAVLVVLANLLADVLYAWLNPRISYD